MRIGIDATSWHNSRGYGRYTRGLVKAVIRIAAGTRKLNAGRLFVADVRVAGVSGDPGYVHFSAPNLNGLRFGLQGIQRSLRDRFPEELHIGRINATLDQRWPP